MPCCQSQCLTKHLPGDAKLAGMGFPNAYRSRVWGLHGSSLLPRRSQIVYLPLPSCGSPVASGPRYCAEMKPRWGSLTQSGLSSDSSSLVSELPWWVRFRPHDANAGHHYSLRSSSCNHVVSPTKVGQSPAVAGARPLEVWDAGRFVCHPKHPRPPWQYKNHRVPISDQSGRQSAAEFWQPRWIIGHHFSCCAALCSHFHPDPEPTALCRIP
jgi:hypothetical protein